MKTIDVRIGYNEGYNITAEDILDTFDYSYTKEVGIVVTELPSDLTDKIATLESEVIRLKMLCNELHKRG